MSWLCILISWPLFTYWLSIAADSCLYCNISYVAEILVWRCQSTVKPLLKWWLWVPGTLLHSKLRQFLKERERIYFMNSDVISNKSLFTKFSRSGMTVQKSLHKRHSWPGKSFSVCISNFNFSVSLVLLSGLFRGNMSAVLEFLMHFFENFNDNSLLLSLKV